MAYIRDFTVDQTLNSQNKPHISLLQMSYVVSIMSIWEKIDHVITEWNSDLSHLLKKHCLAIPADR